MTFSSLLGNDKARVFLEQTAMNNASSQVLLLAGPKGVGKRSFALAYAKSLLGEAHAKKIEEGIHPDVLSFKPEGKTYMHPIASIRKILEEASAPPFEAPYKVYIIEDVERMLPTSSNALLKTLEEPYSCMRFLLLTSRKEEVLPTLLSRALQVPFYPIEETSLASYLVTSKALSQEEASSLALASHGSLSKALALMENREDPIRLYFMQLLTYLFSPFSLAFSDCIGKWEKLLEKKLGNEEEEGALMQVIDPLFEELLFWIRDLHLLKNKASASLFHQAFRGDLERQAVIGKVPSLESVFSLIEEARMALQRSIKPRIVLEHVFFPMMKRGN